MPDSLNDRLHQWLSENASEAAADAFLPELRPQLREWGLSPTGPISEDDWQVVRDRLDEEMQETGWKHLENAAAEAERAREKGQTLREWIRDVYCRVCPEEEADRLAERVEQVLQARDDVDLDAPPPAPDILSYRLILNQVGGGAVLATARQNPRLN